MNQTRAALFVIALAVVGCKKDQSAHAKSTPRPTPAPDPVAELKRIAAKFPTGDNFSFDGNPLRLGDVTFDVRKTDSLVSPIVGNIDFYFVYYEPVSGVPADSLANWTGRRVRLALNRSDDRWELQNFTVLETGDDVTEDVLRSPDIAAFVNTHGLRKTK